MLGNFSVGHATQNVKYYLINLKVDGMRLFIAVEKGGGKMSESVIAMVFTKAKVASRKCMSIVRGREVKSKDKIEGIANFAPYESPTKKECAEDLEKFLTKENEELGAMK